jgi:hypothetical protein
MARRCIESQDDLLVAGLENAHADDEHNKHGQ